MDCSGKHVSYLDIKVLELDLRRILKLWLAINCLLIQEQISSNFSYLLCTPGATVLLCTLFLGVIATQSH